MALRQTMQTPFGVEVKAAYIRVEGVRIVGKTELLFRARVSVDGVLPHFSDISCECAYDLDGDNPFKQAYAYLKTLPEFENAENV